MPFKTAIIGGGINLLGKGIDALLGNTSMQQQFENIRQLRQEENTYNHPAAQRARMEAAGYSAFAGDVSPGQASTTTDAPYNKAIENGLGLGQSGTNMLNLMTSASNLLNDDMQRQNLKKQLEVMQAEILLKQAHKIAVEKGYDKIAAEIDKLLKESSFIEWQEERGRTFAEKELNLLDASITEKLLSNEKLGKELDHFKKTGQWIGHQTDNIITILRHYLPDLAEDDLRQLVFDMYMSVRERVKRRDYSDLNNSEPTINIPKD